MTQPIILGYEASKGKVKKVMQAILNCLCAHMKENTSDVKTNVPSKIGKVSSKSEEQWTENEVEGNRS